MKHINALDTDNLVFRNHLSFDIDVENILDKNIHNLYETGLNIYFVLGYPRSDMGKGILSATLCKILDDANLIKYDGLLNTNRDNRHLTTERDDFETYEHINPDMKFGKFNHILLGATLSGFIKKYGEGDHISFRPHFANYYINQIYTNWKKLGKPKNLIVEIGGTINDSEVAPFVPYAISFFKRILNNHCKIILLTEIGFNGYQIKTKVAQDAVQTFVSKSICPDYLLLREPKELSKNRSVNRDYFHQEVSKKISDNLNVAFEYDKIQSIPFFKDGEVDYKNILCKVLKIKDKSKIFLGTRNKGKIADWRRYFTYIDVVSAYDLNKEAKDRETSYSIFENAKNKAIDWSKATDLITASDDTGFFIPALGGKPGVSVKTFDGELPSNRTNKEYIKHIIKRVSNLDNRGCYFESAIAFARNGILLLEDSYRLEGELIVDNVDLNKLKFEEGFPLASVFKPYGARDIWVNLSDEEKSKYDSAMIECVNKCLKRLFI